MKKRILGLLLCAVVALGAAGCSSSSGNSSQSSSGSASDSSASQTASWDAKNINLIVPLKAGGDTDFYARTYAKYLE